MTGAAALAVIERERVVMVVRAPALDAARTAIAAAVAGGVRVIEVTFTVPDAVVLIRELAEDPRLLVGAGTVLDTAQADAAMEAGAAFVVSPGLNSAVVEHVVAGGALMLPGVLTPTEVLRALELGAPAVKLFPADLAGPAHLRALRGPLPDLKVIPSGGVTADNARRWLEAGAIAVGLAGSLSPSVAAPDADAVMAEARRVLAAVNSNRPEGDKR